MRLRPKAARLSAVRFVIQGSPILVVFAFCTHVFSFSLRPGYSPPTRLGSGLYDRGRPERGPCQVSPRLFLRLAACVQQYCIYLISVGRPVHRLNMSPSVLRTYRASGATSLYYCCPRVYGGWIHPASHAACSERHTPPPSPHSQVQRNAVVHPGAAGATHPGDSPDGRFRSPERDGRVVRLSGEPAPRHLPLRAASDQLAIVH